MHFMSLNQSYSVFRGSDADNILVLSSLIRRPVANWAEVSHSTLSGLELPTELRKILHALTSRLSIFKFPFSIVS